ncbi:outer membrane protein assembly factor BamE domain-containing protein [Uliginosibacterium sp. H1]|uniref:outer membrane protein assembly factor BamE domain-containing protein n=1 Tax=Uliginosibacterium sp. H1 TaxID=3114757 RepID=UPI002E19275B|nr:outer membrane protein assembly factor BamE [Uliginosibacterium sp. H1]
MRTRSLLQSVLMCTALAIGLTACASFIPFTIEQGQTREHVVSKAGRPAHVWKNADGTETLEYPQQPYGTACYMVTVGADGKVLRVDNALQPENLARVAAGMSEEQVLRLLGSPRQTNTYKLSGETVLDWNVRDPGVMSGMRFNVHFKDGKVARTSQSYYDSRDFWTLTDF